MLLLGVLLLFVIVDIMMVPLYDYDQNINFNSNATIPLAPISPKRMYPYHFWVMGILFYAFIAAIALTYWKHTGKTKGAITLFLIGAIFSLFLVEDVLYFAFQGQPIPESWGIG